MLKKETTCKFCCPQPAEYLRNYDLDPLVHSKPLWRTENLVVTTDLLPISDDFHLLITTPEHLHAFATTPSLDPELASLLKIMQDKLGPLLLIEHGGVDGESHLVKKRSGVQSIYHRHIHVLPAQDNLLQIISEALDKANILYTLINTNASTPLSIAQLIELGEQKTSYLFAHSLSHRQAILAPDEHNSFPSQISQRALAPILGGQQVNWKKMSESTELQGISAQRIKSTIERCCI